MLLKAAGCVVCVHSWLNTAVTVGLAHHSHSGAADVASWELGYFSSSNDGPPAVLWMQTVHARTLEIRPRREKANWLIMEVIAVKFISV